MNKQVKHINWNYALYDVMEDVCKNLNVKALHNMAKVNKSWRAKVLREITKRCYIQQLRLNYNFNNPSESSIAALSNKLRVNSQVSLLIYGTKLLKSDNPPVREFNEMLLRDFKQKLPHKAIVLNVNDVLTTDDVQAITIKLEDLEATKDKTEDVQDMKIKREVGLTDQGDILGLFFPGVEQRANVQVAWAQNHYGHPAQTANELADELGLDDSESSESTLMVFAYSYQGFRIASELVGKRIDRGTETIWTGIFEDHPLSTTCSSNNYHSMDQSIVAMRISGPGVKSWSTVLDSRWSVEETTLKLKELNSKVQPRRHCTGLIYATSKNAYGTNSKLMSVVKGIFDGIPFVGVFDKKNWVSSFPGLEHYLSYSVHAIPILIISYD